MKNQKPIPAYVTILLFALAMVACVFGIYRGEVAVVLQKAVNICMECIGIG